MFRRRPPAEPVPQPDPSVERPGSKGRPTPKRSEAEKHRRTRARAPKDRKEAYRASRARAKEERLTMRRALVTGDERNLPPRDQGPVKRFARDWVDHRRRAGELFLPGAVVVFILNLTAGSNPQLQSLAVLIWFALILYIVFGAFMLVRSVKRQVAERFPKESTRGLASYVVLRSMQIRKLRLPKPQVKPGTQL